MQPLTTDLAEQILALVTMKAYSLLGAIQDNKVVLGGSAGSGGGTGDPPAGFVGQLTQSNVTFDTAGSSRACSAGSAGSSSLVDNLDAIRLGIEICDDAIGDRHIDWGHGAGQVDAEDVPVSSGSLSSTNVHDALEELYGVSAGSAADHGTLTGLADDDDHTQYLLADGARALAGAWDVGANLVTFGAGITFDGASAANIITVPDNIAQAMNLVDAGGLEYMRVVSTDANRYLCFFPGGGGNVGIGTPTPSELVEAVRSQNTDTTIAVNNVNVGNVAKAVFRVTSDAGLGEFAAFSAAHVSFPSQVQVNSNMAGGLAFRAVHADGDIRFLTKNTLVRMIIDQDGNVGMKVPAPQGLLHGFDTHGGFMYWEGDVDDGNDVTVIPNGAGDVERAVFILSVTYCNTAAGYGSTHTVLSNPGATPITGLYVDGVPNELKLQLMADGSVVLRRTQGTDTYDVCLWLIWQ